MVLGVGGNVGQGILKALSQSELDLRVIGACIHPLSFGLYTSDRGYLSPPASDPGFLDWLINICIKEGVGAVLSGVEPVLDVLAPNAELIRKKSGAICIVSNPDVLEIAKDKLLTCQWLERSGCNYPAYASTQDGEAVRRLKDAFGFPLLAKPRLGKGSQGIQMIEDDSQFEWLSTQKGYIIQEYLGSEDTEYTVGCFCDSQGNLKGSMAMRRELLQGTTSRAIAGDFPNIRAEAEKIVKLIRPSGPCNIQLREHAGKPVCFEINMRFSGTTPIRTKLGFKEVDAALRNFVLNEDIDVLPPVTKGIAVRYWNELYIDQRALEKIESEGFLEEASAYSSHVEQYGMKK